MMLTRHLSRRLLGTAAVLAAATTAVATFLVAAPASAALSAPRPPVTFRTAPEQPTPYVGQVICDPAEKPGAVALRDLLRATYGWANTGGISRSCSTGGRSEHKEGRAYDWGTNVNSPTQKAMADHFVGWVTGPDAQGVAGGNAHRLGVMYVIWNKRIWNARSGWKAYTGASPHTDHVHVSLSWDGAYKRTSWWTGTALTSHDYGPCQLVVGEPPTSYTTRNTAPCPRPVPRVDGTVTADFDGDRRADVASYYDGRFVIRRASGGTLTVPFGRKGDQPVAGDWNGDGRAGVGVLRAGTWYLRNSLVTGPSDYSFAYGGASGLRPVAGDWNGDGKDSVGVVRDGTWYLRGNVSATGKTQFRATFGVSTDLPVVGDWDRSGKDTIGVFRSGTWLLASTPRGGAPVQTLTFGHRSGQPLVGDFNGDGRTTVGTVLGGEVVYTDDPAARSSRTMATPF